MTATARDLCAAFARGLRPRDKLTVSEWADRYRILPAKGAAEPGPWRTSRTPYLREPMNAMSSHHPAEVVVLKMASQVGKSEAINNLTGYVIDHDPGPVLMVQPTIEAAQQYSTQRIAPMCEVPPLAGLVAEPRSSDGVNTQLVKEFPGGVLVLRGANSAAGLSSMPIRVAIFDEVDRYPVDVDDNGDPITVGTQRTATYAHSRKVVITSTPTVKGASRVDVEFEQTDQRVYEVPCPHCGTLQALRWSPSETHRGGVVWEATDPEGTAQYRCGECLALIHPRHKPAMVAAGRWRATAPGNGRRYGYQLSALYSPWRTWGELAAMFLQAKSEGPGKLKAFVNLQLGESWDAGEVSTADARGLKLRMETGWGAGCDLEVPAKACVLTAGVDVQPVRGCVVVEVVAWGEGLESWSIDYVQIDGDPQAPPPKGVWAELDAFLSRSYRHPVLGQMPIRAVCVDTGAATTQVYAFVRPRQKRRVWGIKGDEDRGQPIWPDKVSRNRNKGAIELRNINTGQAKEDVYWRLRIPQPGPGFSHFPAGRDAAYFEELTAETQRQEMHRGRGRRRWVIREGIRNEALDCRVYAYAAVLGLIRQRAVTLAPPKLRPGADPPVFATVDATAVQVQPTAKPRRAAKPPPKNRGDWWSGVLDGW